MGTIAISSGLWAALGTVVGTFVLLIAPGVMYAWYVLEHWIGDNESYASVISEVE